MLVPGEAAIGITVVLVSAQESGPSPGRATRIPAHLMRRPVSSESALPLLKRNSKRVERQRTQQIPAHSALHLGETVGGRRYPFEVSGFGQFGERGGNVGIPDQVGRARNNKNQVAQQRVQRTNQVLGLFASFGPGPIG